MNIPKKEALKEFLGEIPLAPEFYYLVRQHGRPISRFSLKHLQAALPAAVAQAGEAAKTARRGKKVLIFATLHYWIEHATVLGLALAGQGHQVNLGYLPFADWQKPISRFDLRRQNVYARQILKQAEPVIQVTPLIEAHPSLKPLPPEITKAIDQVSGYDTQYTLQVEEVNKTSEIYRMRLERNEFAARVALAWMQAKRPDVVIVPNGTIQELGIVYRVARYLRIPVVTYEFGDQNERVWLAQSAEVMRQETDGLWQARRERPLTQEQFERLHALFAARQKGVTWENFSRQWQDTPSQGGEQARAALGLDQRPVVLLATNVLGDSLTLGRQVFSQTMAEWISRSVQYFSGCPEVQLIIRIHPGEVLTHGPSMVDVVHGVLPHLPEHIRLIGPREKINTYDLIEVADLGLVYTTTVGMEMAMSGLPVVVSGQTHYRGRGFTIDPDSWVSYFKILGQVLANPARHRLTQEQVEQAWNYAYRFFFEYPRPFPWHLVHLWDDFAARPMASVLSPAGLQEYGATFRYFTGEKMDWTKISE